MRFKRVTLTNFRGIESATVEFGAHLNIVFGPNDLGKSTLAEAIRAALLLQTISTEGKKYAPWHKGVTPAVELVFVDDGGHTWRVTKGFRTDANIESTLAHSKDGSSFTVDARGREVDQKIREKLAWGVATPGGRSGTRGMPRSFIVKALLSEQTEVGHILESSLAEDSDDSGKLRLKKALSALAEDPEVRKVLDAAQKERDRYFTSTGRQRSGKSSPLRPLQEELKAHREEKDKLEVEWRAAETARKELSELEWQLQAKAHERDAKAGDLEDLETLRVATQAHDAACKALEAAEARLAEIVRIEQGVTDLRARLGNAEEALEESKTAATERATKTEEARATKEAADQGVRAVESESGTNEALLEKARAERRISEIERNLEQLQTRQAKAAEALETLSALRSARENSSRVQEEIASAVQAEESAKAAMTAAGGDIDRLSSWRRLQELAALKAALESKQNAQHAAQKTQAEIDRLASVISETSSSIEALAAPDRNAFKATSALHHERELLRGRTSAGLEVHLDRLTSLAIQTTADDAQAIVHEEATDSVEVEADRTMTIVLPGVADIRVATGTKELREQLRLVEARWRDEGEPLLERAGVATIAALEAAVEERERLQRTLHDAELKHRTQLEELRRQEAAAVGLTEAARDLAAKHEETSGVDPNELVAELRERHPGIDLATLSEAALRATLRTRERAHQEHREHLIELRAQAGQAQKEVAALEEQTQQDEAAAGKLPSEEAETVARLIEDATAQLQQVQTRIAELEGIAQKAAAEAEQRAQQAARHLAAAQASEREALEARDGALATVSQLKGALSEKEERLAQVDRGAAESAVRTARTALEATPAPERMVDEALVEAAQASLDETVRELVTLERERENQRGALRQTGGLVVRERLIDAERAVERAQEDLRTAELDAEAVKLLLETLKEAQQLSSQHVGTQLAKPVEERFRTLTNGRYDRLTIGPELSTGDIRVAGIVRGAADLSVGTREQLATILRLVIAEHLRAPIILDDHLAQTDRARLGWFVDVLKAAATKTQVIVMTCRHDDYLAPPDWPTNGHPIVDRGGGALRAIDLEQLVQRWRPENAREAATAAFS